MITLYQFAPAWGLPNLSSFCLKLETYLRMAEIPYETVSQANPSKSPKGKLPYITDNGKTIADSNAIIAYLKATYGDPLDGHLSPTERAIVLAMQRLIEENLYWVALYSRWLDPVNFKKTKAVIFASLPPVVRTVVALIIRNKVLRDLKGQGIGRHSTEEIYQIGITDLNALSDFLADKPFFMGNQPTTLDASAYGLLANILWVPLESPLKDHAEKLSNLSTYCQRMKATFYGE